MSDFNKAIEIVLTHEGFYSNDPADRGGATKYGVSLRFLQSLDENLGDVDRDGDVDIQDVKSLTLDQAKNLYKSQWWDKYNYSQIRDDKLATKVLDLSINMGASQAHKLLQTAVNRIGLGKLAVDGKLGPKTWAAIDVVSSEPIMKAYADEAARFYIDLTFKRIRTMGIEQGGKYLFGWIRRAYALT
jgi:lysozyme family protein